MIVGIDGEGHDLPDGRHIYTHLIAVNEQGKLVAEVYNKNGLSTEECCEMLLQIPKNTLRFVFMGSYDWTKIIEDLRPLDRYMIMRPNFRKRRYCKSCSHSWKYGPRVCSKCGGESREVTVHHRVGKYRYDWFNGSFTVGRTAEERSKTQKSTKVWDCFRFFGCSFVKALDSWNIGTPEQRKRIKEMKDKRGSFQDEDPKDVRKYCIEECHLLAQMMRKVIKAHEDAGLNLTRFDGVGSTATALLRKHGVEKYLGPRLCNLPSALQHAIMAAFFGGRFENSVVGAVEEPVFNRDIHSAYPYAQATNCPCLMCGTWKKTKSNDVMREVRKATIGLVKFRVKKLSLYERQNTAWLPLPCRDKEGSICYPSGFTGWAWSVEIEAALKGWPDLIEVLEAWTYTTSCKHKPWGWVPSAYLKRLEWGKDGAGLVMKGGINAGYGKTAQSLGDAPPFQSWIWAGITTATTRAQLLYAILAHKDPWKVLAVATDGLFTTENPKLPNEEDTGTDIKVTDQSTGKKVKKPLGAWGMDEYPNGVFFVKPGLYFDDTKGLMRARGVGRAELTKSAVRLAKAFKAWNRKGALKIEVKSRRFYGARSSVLGYSQCLDCRTGWPGVPELCCPKCKEPGDKFHTGIMTLPDKKTPAYGRWHERKIEIEFACLPKRESFDWHSKKYSRLRVRDMGGFESQAYFGETTPEGEEARLANEAAMEEPDWNDSDIGM